MCISVYHLSYNIKAIFFHIAVFCEIQRETSIYSVLGIQLILSKYPTELDWVDLNNITLVSALKDNVHVYPIIQHYHLVPDHPWNSYMLLWK